MWHSKLINSASTNDTNLVDEDKVVSEGPLNAMCILQSTQPVY